MESNQSSFWQFSDQLRLQTNSLANLSLNDSIWSNSYVSKRPGERRNFDINAAAAVAAEVDNPLNNNDIKSDFNSFGNLSDNLKTDFNSSRSFFNDSTWKISSGGGLGPIGSSGVGLNGGFNKGIYSNPSLGLNLNYNSYNKNGNNNIGGLNTKGYKNGKGDDDHGKIWKKNKNNKLVNKDGNDSNGKNSVDKRFKTLPPSESLPRNETIGGYIFVCNNDTMQENLKRELFGLPPRYRDSVRAITPGLPLFLYNYSTHQLHGIFEASSFGGTNIDPSAWEDKKNPGESRFPAQVQVITRKVCEPLEEDSFRPILHHYDGPKFRLELNVPEALSLLDIFAESHSA